ncbi:hypothetical protein EBW23_07320 [bacterium]|nr:hypothetical protein [bacterium]
MVLCVFSLLILSNRASTLSNRASTLANSASTLSNRASTLAKSASTVSNRALIHDRNLLNSDSVVIANIMTSARVADFLASSEMSSDIVRTMFWLIGAVLLSCICDPFAVVMCKRCVRGEARSEA